MGRDRVAPDRMPISSSRDWAPGPAWKTAAAEPSGAITPTSPDGPGALPGRTRRVPLAGSMTT